MDSGKQGPKPAPRHTRIRIPLGVKLAAALAAATVVMLGFLVIRFGPGIRAGFLERTDGLISLSRDAMEQMARDRTAQSRDVLLKLIRHTTEARRRLLGDLPLSLYGGDVQRIREAIADADRAKGERLIGNVEILADEMERRFLRDVERRLDEIGAQQTAMGETFAAGVRRSYLILTGTVLMSLVVLLGFGLYHGVINPVRKLRRVTQAVTRGDLHLDVSVRSADEVGDLGDDFAAMVAQLSQSREDVRLKALELEELNRNLEAEVARKTRHLEQALHDLKRAQGRLIHAAKMASVGTLAGGVAHEFNNLIGGIQGCATEALETDDDPRSREPLQVILRAAVRAGEITQQLLRFSRRKELRRTPTQLDQVVGECLRLVEPEARRRTIRIERLIPEGITLIADPDALHQILLNLLTNAMQAMPGGGTIAVKVECDEQNVSLQVSDSGVGIPPEARDHVFEPFFTTREREEDPPGKGVARGGAGLGLSVSYGLVEAHGGTIEFESEVGKGTRFVVMIPRTRPEESNG